MGYKSLATVSGLFAISSAAPLLVVPEQYLTLFSTMEVGQFNDIVAAVARLYGGLLASVGVTFLYSRDSRLSRARNALLLLIVFGSGCLFLLNLQYLSSGVAGLTMLPVLGLLAVVCVWSVVVFQRDFRELRTLRRQGHSVP